MTRFFKKWFPEPLPEEQLAEEFREACKKVVQLSKELNQRGLSVWVKWDKEFFGDFSIKRLGKIEVYKTTTRNY